MRASPRGFLLATLLFPIVGRVALAQAPRPTPPAPSQASVPKALAPTPATPSDSPPPSHPAMPPAPVSMMASSSRAAGLSARILWIDATANAAYLNSEARVREVVDHCIAAHLNGIVVDVKPLSGEVLYDSRFAPRMSEWKGIYYPLEFDVLKSFVERGREAGIPIYASVNVFSEGHKSFMIGPAYSNKDWQIVSYETAVFVAGTSVDPNFPLSKVNASPAANELSAYVSGAPRLAKPGETCAAYDAADHIATMTDGSKGGDPISIPVGGGILVGRGAASAWMARNLTVGGTVRFIGQPRFFQAEESDLDPYSVFVNPISPQVRRHALDIIREVVRNYPVHGIFLDRMRYPNLHADFSDASRRAFERRIGHSIANWPEDIVTFPARPGSDPIRGPLFNAWLEWRSGVIRDFLAEARSEIRKIRKAAQVGVYVGSWYSVYYDVGVNWGSPAFPNRFDWMTPDYPKTGYAPLLDLICSGTYYPLAWKSQASAAGSSPNATVEGSAEESLAAVRDETPLYGSLYLIQYQRNPEAFRQAIRASLATTGGVMLFDLSYLVQYDWWKILEEELPASAVPPHLAPGFAEAIRVARHAADNAAETGGERIVAPNSHPPL